MATIYDVAAKAGVSPKTVSRVLNGDGPVGAETRAAVTAAMTALGYAPSSAARAMRSARTGLVGLVTGAILGPLDRPESAGLPDLFIVQGVQRAMAEAGLTLMIADTAGRPDAVAGLLRTFLQHRVEGLIYVADRHREVALPPVSAGTPIVLANCFDARGTPSVLPEDEGGQRDLVARLVAAGHRRIAYLTLPAEAEATRLRLQGYLRALRESGIAADPALVGQGYRDGDRKDPGELRAQVDRLLALPEPPTVICCGNDEMAMRLYGILRTSGLRVPEDVSVAGYDDHRAIAETLYPPLTTVKLAYAEMGERAAGLLMSLIRGEPAPEAPLRIPGPVRWRASVTERNA